MSDTATAYEGVRDALLASVSGRTREGYLYDLRAWERYCDTLNVDPLGADRRIVQGWAGWMRDRGLAARTINTRLSRVHGVYEAAYLDGVLTADPTVSLKHMRCPRPAPRLWLGPSDLSTLLAASLDDPDPMLAALVHLWALSGTRTSETLGLDINDLSSYEGATVLSISRAKSTCTQHLTLPDATGQAIAKAVGDRRSGPVFLSRLGLRMTAQMARVRLRHLTDRLSLPAVTPQGLRVGFITLALKAGIPEREVMISAGHASSAQTAKYDQARTSVEEATGVKLSAWLGSQPT